MKRLIALVVLACSLGAQSFPFPGPGRKPASGGGIAYTGKTCMATRTNALTATCTWTSPPAAGENVYCAVVNYYTDSYVMTDSASNSYTANGVPYDLTPAGGPYGQLFYVANLPGSITTTSVTVMSSLFLQMYCLSVTGGNASPVDGAYGSNRASASSISTTVSPTSSSTILFSIVYSYATTVTAGSGFTIVAHEDDGNGDGALQYKISSTAGSNTCDASISSSTNVGIMCQAYK